MAIHATKLHQPHLRANSVIRKRLLASFDRGPEEANRLILVSAPASSVKTTLLAHPLAAHPCPGGRLCQAAWLSLDQEDDDPVRFWSCATWTIQRTVAWSKN